MINYRKTNRLKTQIYLKFSILFCLFLMLLVSTIPMSSEGQSDQMPDYAKNIIVEDHYIKITQESKNSMLVEEIIWYKNEGTENYTGKIYTWAQPGEIMNEIHQFDVVIDQQYTHLKVYPSVNFLVSDLEDNNMSIAANESLEIVFVYTLEYPLADEFSFTKTFLYNNSNVIVIIEPNENFNVVAKEGLNLFYEPNTKTYVTEHAQTLSKELSEYITIEFIKKSNAIDGSDGTSKSGDVSYTNLIYVIAIIIICVIITIFVRHQRQKTFMMAQKAKPKQKTHQKTSKPMQSKSKVSTGPASQARTKHRVGADEVKEEKGGKRTTKPKPDKKPSDTKRKQLIQEKRKILKTTERIKSDYKVGIISQETFENLKNEYKKKLKTINKNIGRIDKDQGLDEIDEEGIEQESPEQKKLMNKKEKILKAIKKLEEDKEAGVLDEDLFDEMSAAYKKQAIEILQKIDQVREKNS